MSGRTNERRRGFTPARIIALIVIALGVLGLVYLRLTGGTSAVSVPAGAHAGQLKLTPCNYTTEKGSASADCGTLVVPENRTNPHSRLIALPVIRIRATSAHPSAADFPSAGRPRHHEHDVPGGEPLHS